MSNTGILSIGVSLPDTVRTNDFWTSEVRASWQSKRPGNAGLWSTQANTAGERTVAAAAAEWREDPFQGSVERCILAEEEQPSDMEVMAARRALLSADCAPERIDFVIQDGPVPDALTVPNACLLHHQLGLNTRCLTFSTSAGCNALAIQMELASALIALGKYKRGLLVQSSAMSRLVPVEARYSPWFGDGATSVVVGPVAAGRGLLASTHSTDGSLADGMVASVPGRRWYEEGRIWWHPHNLTTARALLPSVAEQARASVQDVLWQARLTPEDVDFYAGHQATRWYRAVTQKHAGLSHARFVDTFARTGSISSANIPLVLATAQQQGLLAADDVIVTFATGNGATWSSMVLRWGT